MRRHQPLSIYHLSPFLLLPPGVDISEHLPHDCCIIYSVGSWERGKRLKFLSKPRMALASSQPLPPPHHLNSTPILPPHASCAVNYLAYNYLELQGRTPADHIRMYSRKARSTGQMDGVRAFADSIGWAALKDIMGKLRPTDVTELINCGVDGARALM